jgi:hypothetical protein
MPFFLLNPTAPIAPKKETRLRETLACKQAAEPVLLLAHKFVTNIDVITPNTLAPFIPDSAYQSAVVYSYLARETGEKQYQDAIVTLTNALEYAERRWKVAGKFAFVKLTWWADVVVIDAYLQMLDEQQSRW